MISRQRSEKSMELFHSLQKKGYPEAFCHEVSYYLNTDWTAQRMLGYLRQCGKVSQEEIADEVIAILEDREKIIEKKQLESVNTKWNQFLNR